jgi:hypothetical protein
LSQRFIGNIKDSTQFMVYTDKPYTNILKGSITDAKLKYFNMKDYFHKISKMRRYAISKNNLYFNFNASKFLNEIKSIQRGLFMSYGS